MGICSLCFVQHSCGAPGIFAGQSNDIDAFLLLRYKDPACISIVLKRKVGSIPFEFMGVVLICRCCYSTIDVEGKKSLRHCRFFLPVLGMVVSLFIDIHYEVEMQEFRNDHIGLRVSNSSSI